MRVSPELAQQLRDLVAGEGLDLVATEVVGSGPRSVLRLIVDGPDGVTLDACATVSRQASILLDVEDPASHSYTLEVSSPGLDRKLYSKNDFETFSGRRISVKMVPSFRAYRQVSGRLRGLDGDTVKLTTDAGDDLEMAFDDIFEARLDVDWQEMLKKRKNSR